MDELIQFLYVGPVGVALILFAISALYFYAGRDLPATKRILTSSHGVVLLFQMAPVAARDFVTVAYGDGLSFVLYGALVLGFIAVAYCHRHSGRRWYFHSVHVLTLLYASLANIYGWQALPHWTELK